MLLFLSTSKFKEPSTNKLKHQISCTTNVNLLKCILALGFGFEHRIRIELNDYIHGTVSDFDITSTRPKTREWVLASVVLVCMLKIFK
jgi:hypothetical protein